MNHQVKISVIVPIYNGEKYLRRCLDSILCQTFTDFELLLINDGSKDSSGAICDEYAARDSRIRVFHKENGGVSSARNVGLENAQGEWISFVDADDWLDSSLYQTCISKSLESDYDLITFDFDMVTEKGVKYWCSWDFRDGTYYNPKDKSLEEILNQTISYSWGIVWNFIIKRNFLTKNDLYFDLGISYSEDTVFFTKIISNHPNLYHISQALYSYNKLNTDSLTNNLSEKNYIDRIQVFTNLSKYFIEKHLYNETHKALSLKFTSMCIFLTKKTSLYPHIIKAMSPNYNSRIFESGGGNIRAKIMLWLITHGFSGLASFIARVKE